MIWPTCELVLDNVTCPKITCLITTCQSRVSQSHCTNSEVGLASRVIINAKIEVKCGLCNFLHQGRINLRKIIFSQHSFLMIVRTSFIVRRIYIIHTYISHLMISSNMIIQRKGKYFMIKIIYCDFHIN